MSAQLTVEQQQSLEFLQAQTRRPFWKEMRRRLQVQPQSEVLAMTLEQLKQLAHECEAGSQGVGPGLRDSVGQGQNQDAFGIPMSNGTGRAVPASGEVGGGDAKNQVEDDGNRSESPTELAEQANIQVDSHGQESASDNAPAAATAASGDVTAENQVEDDGLPLGTLKELAEQADEIQVDGHGQESGSDNASLDSGSIHGRGGVGVRRGSLETAPAGIHGHRLQFRPTVYSIRVSDVWRGRQILLYSCPVTAKTDVIVPDTGLLLFSVIFEPAEKHQGSFYLIPAIESAIDGIPMVINEKRALPLNDTSTLFFIEIANRESAICMLELFGTPASM